MGAKMKCGVIGLGKLGYCLAAVLNSKYDTVGIDVLKNPLPPKEPGLNELLYGVQNISDFGISGSYPSSGKLKTTTDYSALEDCTDVFCLVPTPSTSDGDFDNIYLFEAMGSARPYLDGKNLNIVSTVMPGTTRLIQSTFPNTEICYNPEFIALGNVVKGITNPDFVLIGESSRKGGGNLEEIYAEISPGAPVHRMNYESAEIAKIALNSYCTMKISFANSLEEICRNNGADINKVTDAIGTDKRIGKKYLKAGGAYGGPCFPRDNRAFGIVAKGVPNYSDLTDSINEHQTEKWMDRLDKIFKGDFKKKVSVLGTGYKNETDFKEEAFGMKLAERLELRGTKVSLDDFDVDTDLVIFALPNEGVHTPNTLGTLKNYAIPFIDIWKDK